MLDAHSQMLIEEYREKLPTYKKVKEIVLEQLKGIIDSLGILVNSIEGRVKTEKSLEGKLERKGYKYKKMYDLTDIVGTRVVTFYSDEIDKVASAIENKFEIDWENSIDKRKIYDVNTFGYMSLHFICRIPKSLYYDENDVEINNVPFEIQIRTVLQHAWASVEHDTGYKTDVEIPKEYLRGLNRLAGILEMADEEFMRLRVSIDEYRRKVRSLVKSGKIDDMELNGDTFNAYVEIGTFDKLNNRIAQINNMEIVPASVSKFLSVLKNLKCQTLGDVQKIIKDYSEKAYQFALIQFGGKDIDIISSSVGITCLCIVYIVSQGFGEAGVKMLYESLYGPRKANESLASKAVESCKKIGLIV